MIELNDVTNLANLDDWQLKFKDQDLRGRTLTAWGGHVVGRIEDMLADIDERRIVALRLESGRVINIDIVDTRGANPVMLFE